MNSFLSAFSFTALFVLAVSCPGGWTNYNNRKCYYKGPEVNFTEAQKFCESIDGQILTIHSKAENDFIQKLFQPANNVWLNFARRSLNNSYRWLDARPVLFTNWNKETKQPTTNNPKAYLHAYLFTGNGDWYSWDTPNTVFCEKHCVKKEKLVYC